MRMSLFDKFLLALILLLLLALSLFAGCVAVGIVNYSVVSAWFNSLGGDGLSLTNSLIFGGVALVLFAAVIRLFAASYGSDRSQSYTRLIATENGEISISIPTIKQIAAAFIATRSDIAASATSIFPQKAGLAVRVRVCVKDGCNLPDVTSELQKDLKAHLEGLTGLAIQRVFVDVDNNRSSYTGRGR